MQFRKPKRLRIISGASLLLLLAGLPLVLSLTRPGANEAGEPPGIAVVYASGLASTGWASLAAGALAAVLAFSLILGQRREVHLRYLGSNARRRHNLSETTRTVAIVVGAAGLIVGSMSGLYAAMLQARPDLYSVLPPHFVTAQLALVCLLGGGALYAAGRVGR